MRIEAPKPDTGMNPWLMALLIMFMIFLRVLAWVVLSIVVYLVLQVGWCMFEAWREMREENSLRR